MFRVGAVLILLTGAAVDRAAGQTLDEARRLYASASYTEALGVLTRLEGVDESSGTLRDVLTVRALCLLALERPAEAQQAVERMVSRDPMYAPDPVEAPPQLRELFRLARERLLPGLVRERYSAAKNSLDSNPALALTQFDGVLALLEAPETTATLGADLSTDLRILATSFRDLAKSKIAAGEAAEKAAETTATGSSHPAARGDAQPEPADTPESSNATVFSAEDADVTPPVVIRQTFPIVRTEWTAMSWRGLLEVVVNESGQVESAKIARAMHPSYNNLLMQETRFWRYKPAMRDGVPVKYRRLIEIVGAPRAGR
jgi:hypothetical protein